MSTPTTPPCWSRPSGRVRSTATTTTLARAPSTSSRPRWSRAARRTTSRSRSRKSPRARSSNTTARPSRAPAAPRGGGELARILLGVSGGIAAYKALEVVRLATRAGHALRVVQTPAAQRFVDAPSFAALTGAPVLVQEWERDPLRGAFPGQAVPEHDPASHLELVRNADAYLIAPASANTIAKLAHGLADNLLTSAALAAGCPVLVAPAMNHHMWEHPATQANLALLRERGVIVVDPGTGTLATKHEWGVGRLAEPAELLAAVEAVVPAGARPWDGLNVLITAGGTREPIDAVRYVGNRSSGRMGYAVAEEAAALGAQVTVIAANVTLPRHPRVTYVDVETAAELGAASTEA